MEFIRSQLTRIQQQLNGLNVSQRMLAGALVAIMVMTLMYWSNFAGKAELEPLLEQSLTKDEIAPISDLLAGKGISYKVAGDRIMVPAEKKSEALAYVFYAQLGPQDNKSLIDEILAKTSPFDSPSKTNAMLLEGKQMSIVRALKHFPRVRNAAVLIDPSQRQGPKGFEPVATVSLEISGKEVPDVKLINAAADLVSGAVSNLPRSRVTVIVNGVSYPVRNRDDDSPLAGSEDWLRYVQMAERHYSEKVSKQFAWIDGVMVSVSVKLNTTRQVRKSHTVDPKGGLIKPARETNSTEDANTARKDNAEPGIVPNGPLAVADTAAGGEKNSETREKSETEYFIDPSKVDVESHDPGGNADPVGVSVLIPRSYFVMAYRKLTGAPADKEPDPAALTTFITDQLTRFKPGVKTCLGLTGDETVHVDQYPDVLPLGGAGSGTPAGGDAATVSAASSLSVMFTDHAKEIALGVLALVSLFMVSNIVKKGTPAMPVEPEPVAAPIAPKVQGPVTLQGQDPAVGEAAEGNALLDGVEMDENSLKATQWRAQVSNMVGDNPDAAATLVRKWLNK